MIVRRSFLDILNFSLAETHPNTFQRPLPECCSAPTACCHPWKHRNATLLTTAVPAAKIISFKGHSHWKLLERNSSLTVTQYLCTRKRTHEVVNCIQSGLDSRGVVGSRSQATRNVTSGSTPDMTFDFIRCSTFTWGSCPHSHTLSQYWYLQRHISVNTYYY